MIRGLCPACGQPKPTTNRPTGKATSPATDSPPMSMSESLKLRQPSSPRSNPPGDPEPGAGGLPQAVAVPSKQWGQKNIWIARCPHDGCHPRPHGRLSVIYDPLPRKVACLGCTNTYLAVAPGPDFPESEIPEDAA